MASHLSSVLRHIRRMAHASQEGLASDRELLERYTGQKDQEAFAELVQRHGPMVLGVCGRVLKNSHDAEDAFQATFLILAHKASSLAWQDSIATWLYVVAQRLARKVKMRGDRQRVCENEAPVRSASVDALWDDVRPILDEEVGRLPEKYRRPVVLCYLEGRTNEEAARDMSCPVGTVKVRLLRAREMLRRRLERRGLVLTMEVLGCVLAERAAPSALSAGWVKEVVQAAGQLAAGRMLADCGVSATVAGLAEGVLKTMLLTKIKIAVLFLSLAGLTLGGIGVHAWAGKPVEAPTPQAPLALADDKTKEPAVRRSEAPAPDVARDKVISEVEPQTAELIAKLSSPVRLDNGFEPKTPLGDALGYLSEKFGIHVIVNRSAFKEDLNNLEVDKSPVHLKKMSGQRLDAVLRLLLTQVQGEFILRQDHIEITTRQRVIKEVWGKECDRSHLPLAHAVIDKRPLNDALRVLAKSTEFNIILDARAGEKVRTLVSAKFMNVPVDTAVRLLANQADLNAVLVDNVLYVTSRENAADVTAEQGKQKPKQSPKNKP